LTSIQRSRAVAVFLASCLLGACNRAPPESPERGVENTRVAQSYAGELKKFDSAIAHGLELSARQPDNSLIPLEVAGLYVERARLTGRYDDFAKAEELLSGLNRDGQSASLCLATARLNFTLHRLSSASRVLESCPPTLDRSEVAALQADIHLYQGQYRRAEVIYRALVNDAGLAPHYVRLAHLRRWLGAPGEAAALLEAAEKRYHGGSPVMTAWLKLQRGQVALDRGRLDEALALFRLASDEMPGWWLVDEHIAEVLLLTGDASGAKTLYENIVVRTDAPEFLDALAGIEMQAGNAAHAQQLIARAASGYKQRMAAFPEAAAGHMVDHALKYSADARMVLQVAQRNFDARPYGESAIALAQANLLAGRPDVSARLINAQLAKGWDTAQAYWMLSRTLARLGRGKEAEAAQSEALRRNAHAATMYGFREILPQP